MSSSFRQTGDGVRNGNPKGVSIETPALLNMMSNVPNSRRQASTALLISCGLVTSHNSKTAFFSFLLSWWTSAAPASTRISAITTLAPSATRASQVALPMPDDPPVITAALPCSLWGRSPDTSSRRVAAMQWPSSWNWLTSERPFVSPRREQKSAAQCI